MCWKQEWAATIGNLNYAILHVERAYAKLQKRLVRNERNLERLKSNPKYNYPTVLAPVLALIEKNRSGIQECKNVIADLKARQDQLFHMIKVYGIDRFGVSKRLMSLMGSYVPKEA
jgi:hypothetical protein